MNKAMGHAARIKLNWSTRYKRFFKTFGLITMIFIMAGCARIPLDQGIMTRVNPGDIEMSSDISLSHHHWPYEQWWKGYGDEQLNHLISQALSIGPSLGVAASRISASQAVLKLESAEQGIDVIFDGSANRQRFSGNGIFPPPLGGNYYSDTTLLVSAGYDFDWWGKHSAMIKTALGEVNARKAEHAQAGQILAAAVAQCYFNLQSDRERLDYLKNIIDIQTLIVGDRAKKVIHGLSSMDEQQQEEIELAVLKRYHASLDTRSRCEGEALRALIGSSGEVVQDLKPRGIPGIQDSFPSNIGIGLLSRRPDLEAAKLRVEASLSRIEAVKAAFYPDINLTGYFGFDALRLDDLMKAPSRTLFIGSTLELPLFDSGRLNAKLEGACAKRDEMIADYNQSVFAAIRDVAQAGLALKGVTQEIKEQRKTLLARSTLLKNVKARFKQGLTDQSTLLTAERAVIEEEDIELQLENRRIQADIALISALGGGYRSESEHDQPLTKN
jgi:outer membrane protein, multidrug efflux system